MKTIHINIYVVRIYLPEGSTSFASPIYSQGHGYIYSI